MENHATRPEVIEAMKRGSGSGDPLQHHRGPRPALSRLSSIRRRPGTHRPRRHTTQRDRDRRRLIPPLIAHRLDPGFGGRAIVGLGLFALFKPAGAPFGALLGTSCQRHVSGKLFSPWRPRRDRAARAALKRNELEDPHRHRAHHRRKRENRIDPALHDRRRAGARRQRRCPGDQRPSQEDVSHAGGPRAARRLDA